MVRTLRARCLLLAGPSSSGKTALARAFQGVADEPWFFFEGDVMSGGFPRGRTEFVTVQWDRRVREACARAARGILEAGINVVVELGLFDPSQRSTIAAVLSAFPTFVVRVRCDLSILEGRESARGDRFAGTARLQYEQLDGLPFDYEAVTDRLRPDTLANDLLQWLASDPAPRAVHALLNANAPGMTG
jgi:chloramphenicol 3-O phosphotransferase